jgi:O-antigen ligase
MKNKVQFILGVSLISLFLFPLFKENISSFFLIITSLLTFLYLLINKIKVVFSKTTAVYTIPFFIILSTNIFASNADIDWKNISKSLIFFVIPFIFSNIPNALFRKLESNYIYYFKYACLIISLYYMLSFLIQHSFVDFFKEDYNESIFRRYVYNDVGLFKIHPTYFSLFLNIGIVHSLIKLKKEKKYLNLVLFVYFIIMILLLSSKVVILIAFTSILYILINNNSFKKKYITGVVLLFFTGIFYLPGIKSRFVEMVNEYKNPPKGMYFNSTNIRKSIFDCSTTILKDNYIKGVGFSNVQKELNNCYKANYDSKFYENHDYLTHNYFMYIFIGSGITGFLFFIIYLINIIIKSLKINNPILNIVLYSCIMLFFFEDFLYRHYGLLFFNLFIFSYFKYNEYIEKQNALDEQ